jgi:hypothetical protein
VREQLFKAAKRAFTVHRLGAITIEYTTPIVFFGLVVATFNVLFGTRILWEFGPHLRTFMCAWVVGALLVLSAQWALQAAFTRQLKRVLGGKQ